MKNCCLILLFLTLHAFHAEAQIQRGTLPVMFDSVRALIKNDLVQVGWSNLTEREVRFYTIERSANGIDFTPVHQLLPSSNLDEKASYSYIDPRPADGANFYRITVNITTGKIITSKILKAHLGVMNPGFTLYPNPVMGNECTISLAAIEKGTYNLQIFNNAGIPVKQLTVTNQGDGITQAVTFPAGMKAGIYAVQIKGEHYSSSQLFIKQ